VLAGSEGATAICAAGNPGMATAGSGDVLTGIAGAVLARRGRDIGGPATGARLASSCMRGPAISRGAEETGETPLVAGDIAPGSGLPRLFRRWAR